MRVDPRLPFLLFTMSSSSRNFFEFFGLERKLSLDEADLKKRFYALSREWHPDRFTRRSLDESVLAEQNTALVNDGYRTLRDPVRRAEYLLSEEGFPIGEQRSKDVPPELLEEVFELNMALEELRGGDQSARSQLEAARASFLTMRESSDEELKTLFRRYDETVGESETAAQALHEVRGVLNRRRYIENLLRDVDKALNPARTPESLEDRL